MGFEVGAVFSLHIRRTLKKLKAGQVDMLSSAWLPSSHGIYKAGAGRRWSRLSSLGFIMNLTRCGAYQIMYLKRRFRSLWFIRKAEVIEKNELDYPRYQPRSVSHVYPDDERLWPERCRLRILLWKWSGMFWCIWKCGRKQRVGHRALWKPQFLHYRYDIRELKEPKGLLGIVDRAVLL